MNDIPDRSTPAYTSVFSELLRLFWTRHRWKILILFIFFLISGQGLFYRSTAAAVATTLILLLSGIWAELSRHGTSPDQRIYHSQMPIPMSVHHLLTQLSGAVWLFAVFLLAVIIPELFKYFKLDAEFRGYVFGLRESPFWMIPIWPLAVLTTYFAISAIVVAVRKPLLWISLVAVAGYSIWSLAPIIGFPQLRLPVELLFLGDFGFFRAIAPSLWIPHTASVEFNSWAGILPTLIWFTIVLIGYFLACRWRKEE